MQTVSQETAREGITINMVSPGRIDTDRVRALDENRAKAQGVSYAEFLAAVEASIPAGHYRKSQDLGALVRFLVSDEAGYVTGQSIIVDGGMVSALPAQRAYCESGSFAATWWSGVDAPVRETVGSVG